MSSLWFKPVCDDVLRKLLLILQNYERGAIYSTRKWLTKEGVKIDRPTRHAHKVILSQNEVDHVIRIIKHLEPENPLLANWLTLQDGLKKGRPAIGGGREVVIAWYRQDFIESIQLLLTAQTGVIQKVESFEKTQKEQGKELFEV